jgi:stearoyl-CoA 9-desaturase NADPH oxidoreductase
MTKFLTPVPSLNQLPVCHQNTKSIIGLLRQCWRWCCQVALVQPSLISYLEPLIRLVLPNFRAQWSHARVIDIQQQAGFIHLTLRPGRRWRGFIPGQHVQLVLEINGRAISRIFSISSSLQLFQQQGLIRLTIQQQSKGLMTSHLMQWLKPAVDAGTPSSVPVHLSAATGSFVLQQQQPLLLLAAGSGITPIHAMLSSVTRLTQPVLLIYSFRGAEQMLFAESWRELQSRFPLLQIQFVDTNLRQRLQPGDVETWCKSQPQCQVYLCGPSRFSLDWQNKLLALGVDASAIQQESFGLAAVPFLVAAASGAEKPESFPIEIRQSTQVRNISSTQGSLLSSLEAAGFNPSYGCRRGICMQCLCQKNQGLVRNLLTGEISDVGPGMIQLCISQPLSAVELSLPSS